MQLDWIGWDLGGAHLKIAAFSATGAVAAIRQYPCPLWQGTSALETALEQAFRDLDGLTFGRHAVTMTGELVDWFPDRVEGVLRLVAIMAERCGSDRVLIFAGRTGFLHPSEVSHDHAAAIASANWLATALWSARQIGDGLLIDIGSTTTDLIPIVSGEVCCKGYTDHERMRYDELVYTGVARTPVMTLSKTVPFEGEWTTLMAEHFATTADVYRLTGELAEHADLMPAADGGDKTVLGSMRRLARLVGRDFESARPTAWRYLAHFLRECQIVRIHRAVERQLSRDCLTAEAPWIGAGVGRFLVRELARRQNRPYQDIESLFPGVPKTASGSCPSLRSPRSGPHSPMTNWSVADCAPAAAVACLAQSMLGNA
ncbi:MAG TPA: hydantoinase/oxoprolinase family protein [Methylococcus sp.]|nr:hydantoinase/oxoprolinase family protein [Methylococcus sp.]